MKSTLKYNIITKFEILKVMKHFVDENKSPYWIKKYSNGKFRVVYSNKAFREFFNKTRGKYIPNDDEYSTHLQNDIECLKQKSTLQLIESVNGQDVCINRQFVFDKSNNSKLIISHIDI